MRKAVYIPFAHKVGYGGLLSPPPNATRVGSSKDIPTEIFKLNFLLNLAKIFEKFNHVFDGNRDFGFIDENGVEFWVQTWIASESETGKQETFVVVADGVYVEKDMENFTSWLSENFEVEIK